MKNTWFKIHRKKVWELPAALSLGKQQVPAVLPQDQAGYICLLIEGEPPDVSAMEKISLEQQNHLPPPVMSTVQCIRPK